MEVIIFMKTHSPKLSDDKYSRIQGAWKQDKAALDHQQALAGAPVGTPSVCQLPGGPLLNIDLQT
jgi:hypothetical protein